MSSQSTPRSVDYVKPSTRLRAMLAEPGAIVCPGVYDGLSARLAHSVGFQAIYMTGAGVTASRLGLADLGFASQDDFVETASMMASLPNMPPLICDADTGFGGPAQIARLVNRYDRAGVAAFHIEDQVQTKRCGHLLGKQLVDSDEFVSRIRAARLARDAIPGGSDIVIIARSDARQACLLGLDATIDRLRAAIQSGADVAFVEGVTSKEDVETAVHALAPTPVLLNLVPGGATPHFNVADAQRMGAKIVIFPGAALAAAVSGIWKAYEELKATGAHPKEDSNAQSSPRSLFMLVGLEDAVRLDAAAGGKAFANGV